MIFIIRKKYYFLGLGHLKALNKECIYITIFFWYKNKSFFMINLAYLVQFLPLYLVTDRDSSLVKV